MMVATKCTAEQRRNPIRNAGVALLFLIGVLTTSGSTQGAPNPLPVLDQVEVNQAISKGVNFLQTHQMPNGTWAKDKSHQVGYAALPGLTLLECGIPANDRRVQAAAVFVRNACASGKVDGTYEIALSIIFLDRLKDPRDRNLIHAMAARLIAGQSTSGGWGYKCPTLSATQTRDILTLLSRLTPPKPVETIVSKPNDPINSPGSAELPPVDGHDPIKPVVDGSPESIYGPARIYPRPGYCIKMSEEYRPDGKTVAAKPPEQKPAKPPVEVKIPPHLAFIPVFQNPDLLPQRDPAGDHRTNGVTDNSNTQFAILALWAAQRHGVPMDRSLNLVVKRFRTSQNAGGTWGYRYGFGGGAGGTNAMTCVGLLGLAIGHGIAQNPDAKERAATDEMLKKGFLALYRMVGKPQGRMRNIPMENLYFMWSVERVAVLYDFGELLDKDWYRWGAEILVANQLADGSWHSEKYHGQSPPLDTCLALLFLKRANLARDLTSKLPYNPSQLNQELIARLPTEPTPPPPPPINPADNNTPPDPNEFVGPPPPTAADLALINQASESDAFASNASTSSQPEEAAPTGGGKKVLAIGLGLVVVLVIFGAIALFVMSRSSDEEEEGKARPRRRRETRRPKKVARD